MFKHTRLRRGGAILAIASVGGSMTGVALASTRGVTYGGSASSGEPVVIALARGGASIKTLSLMLDAPCAGGQSYPYSTDSATDMSLSKRGDFAGVHTIEQALADGSQASGTAIATGKVVGKRLSGAVAVQIDIMDAAGAKVDDCKTRVTFQARSARRKIFGGVTSQDLGVVIELTANRKAVRRMRIGSRAVCSPAGASQDYDTLTNFAIRGGHFGSDWTQRSPDPSRAQDRYDYSLRGTLRDTSISGTFSTKWVQADETGALVTCDTGPLTYRVRSG